MVGAVPAPRPREEVDGIVNDLHVALVDQDVEGAQAVARRFAVLAGKDEQLQTELYRELSDEAHRREMAGEWFGAETIYRAAVAMAEAEDLPGHQFRNHHALSNLFDLLQEHDRALEEATLARDAIKSKYFPLGQYMAVYNLCKRALAMGDTVDALAHAEELVRTEREQNPARAHSLLLRASCLLTLGQLDRAAQDIRSVEYILTPQAHDLDLSGIQSGLADMWTLRAQLKAPVDPQGALEAMWEAVQIRRHLSKESKLDGPFKFNALAISLYQFATLNESAGNTDTAAHALAESDSIRDRIHLFPYREIFTA
jgi:tetratricopeptide (TPR) repeat protein